MFNPGMALLNWWKTASSRSRWYAGVLLFSLFCTIGLIVLTGMPADGDPSAPGVDFSFWYLVEASFKLLFVLALIIGGAVVLRHYSHKRPFQSTKRQLEIIETVRLSPRQALHLVRAGQQYMILGATDQSVSLISQMDLPEMVNQPKAEILPAAEVLPGAGTLPTAKPAEISFAQILSSFNSLKG